MLIDGVRELDELELWSSWKSENDEKELVEFKEKIRYMVEKKGDGGKVAFLESVVGLSLPSAMNVARYLSAERLPDLVCKVRAKLPLCSVETKFITVYYFFRYRIV